MFLGIVLQFDTGLPWLSLSTNYKLTSPFLFPSKVVPFQAAVVIEWKMLKREKTQFIFQNVIQGKATYLLLFLHR